MNSGFLAFSFLEFSRNYPKARLDMNTVRLLCIALKNERSLHISLGSLRALLNDLRN